MEDNSQTARWHVVRTTWGDLHVMPIYDLRPHVARVWCWCCPRQDDEDDGVIIHTANGWATGTGEMAYRMTDASNAS